ncbi:hypothetical protein PYW07_011788 [Mythimna separata]|uniref:Uncharacterized protein n=1 Tax=Mythimna separata TaxID=271217 RepID=A0AAD7Y798_MYTSE|nr:hypothetical protein PYW07_011788 [Mythimna separata]
MIPQYLTKNMTADTEENNSITAESYIYKLETEENVEVNRSDDVVTNIDSSLCSIDDLDVEENNNITREPYIDQSLSYVNDNSNKLETEENIKVNGSEDVVTNIDSSLVSIDELDVAKTLHILENVAPIETSTNDMCDTYQEHKENEITVIDDARILNNVAGASLDGNVTEDETAINSSIIDLKEIETTHNEAGSNCANNSETNNVIDDETIQGLKEFEAVLNNIDKPVLTDEFGIEIINLDELNNIFDDMDAVNEDVFSIDSSDNDKEVYNNDENIENATCNEKELTDSNNAINSDLNDNIDIISINSFSEDEKSQTEESKDTVSTNVVSQETDSDDGYNSSDFEFISESEANMAGIVINYRLENHQNLLQTNSEPLIFCFDEENREENEPSDPGEGPSRQNRPRNEFEDRSYRNDHRIPIGDDYLGLFQGIYNPLLPMSDIIFLENKSVRVSAMNMQYDGIGFEKQLVMRRHQPDSSEDEFEDEAKESAKKILNMYPGENRKRRRRFL